MRSAHNLVVVKLSWFLGQSSAHRGLFQLSRFLLFAWLQIQNYWLLYSSSTTNTDVIKAQRWRRTMNDCACFCHMLTHNLEFAHEKQEREYTDHPAGKVVPGPPLWSGSPAKNTGTSQWLRQRCSHSLEPGAELHFPLLSLKGSLPLAWYHCPPHLLLCPESLPTDLTSLGTSWALMPSVEPTSDVYLIFCFVNIILLSLSH